MKIMFVCHGNICRSPMAEFIMRDLLVKEGLDHQFTVSSCATSDEEIINGIGCPVYPPARKVLERHGIDCGEKRAVRLVKDDYNKWDLFLCMDEKNLRNAKKILNGDPGGKIHKFLSFTGNRADVSDPWYTGDFDTAYNDILLGCFALLEKLKCEAYRST